ncbi:MAG: hypothetical protein KY476_22260 [Planctomycetes bacterium]|nr:hypothetical protein [Planctomycetota bacterium]
MATDDLIFRVGVIVMCSGMLIELVAFALPALFGWQRRRSFGIYAIGFMVFYLGVVLVIAAKVFF